MKRLAGPSRTVPRDSETHAAKGLAILYRSLAVRRGVRSFALSPAAAAEGADPFGQPVLFPGGGTLRIAFPIRRISPRDGAPPLTDSAPLPSWDREKQLA